jgi:hypothetical protein
VRGVKAQRLWLATTLGSSSRRFLIYIRGLGFPRAAARHSLSRVRSICLGWEEMELSGENLNPRLQLGDNLAGQGRSGLSSASWIPQPVMITTTPPMISRKCPSTRGDAGFWTVLAVATHAT